MLALIIVTSLLLFTVVAWWRREVAAAVILAAVPTYLVRFKLFGIPLTLLEAGILVLFGIWVIQLVRQSGGVRSAWRSICSNVSPQFAWLTGLWVAIGLAAALLSNEPVAGLGLWKAYFLEPALFGLILLYIIRSELKLKWLLFGLGVGVLIVGLISIFQALGLLSSPEPWASQSPARLSSVFEYPNAVGLLVAPIIALFIGLLVYNKEGRRLSRLFPVGVILFGLFAVAAAVSEGAVLGLALAGILLAILSKRRWLWLGLLGVLLAVCLIAPLTRQYVLDLATFQNTSGDVRLRLWTGTVDLLKAHPIEGAGLGGFPVMYDVYRDAAHVELLLYPHNVFLNFWVELGLAGLVVWLALVIRFFTLVIRTIRRSAGFYKATALSVLLAMTALLGHGLVDVPYFKNDLAILFVSLIVIVEIISADTGQNNKNTL